MRIYWNFLKYINAGFFEGVLLQKKKFNFEVSWVLCVSVLLLYFVVARYE